MIDGKTVNSDLNIDASNVTIRNSKVNGQIRLRFDSSATNLLIEDTEVDGGGSTWGACITDQNFTARRVNVHGCENGIHVNHDVTVEDSYIHNLSTIDGTGHVDGAELDNGPATFQHNTVVSFNTSTVNIYNENPPIARNISVLNNKLLMTDDHLAVYCPRYVISNPQIYVNNNRIDDANHADLTDSCLPGNTITEFSGNVVDSTGAPIGSG